MVYLSDVSSLIASWTERMKNNKNDEYVMALKECIYDLNSVVEKNIEEELDYQHAYEMQLADEYLSSMEAHDLN